MTQKINGKYKYFFVFCFLYKLFYAHTIKSYFIYLYFYIYLYIIIFINNILFILII
jgi:hypothetical protein